MNVGLRHRVSILRNSPTGGEDEWGLPSEALVTIATNVPALVQDRSAREQPRPSGVEITDALIFMGWGADVRADDLLQHGSAWYRVVGTPMDAGGAKHHLEMTGRKVEPGG